MTRRFWISRKLLAGTVICLVALCPRVLNLGQFLAPDEQLIWKASNEFIYIAQLQRGKHDSNILEYLSRRPPEFELMINGFKYGALYPGPAAQFSIGE
jgi:hypothetical protein